jgi:iron complex transport system substrate-binding protein
MCAEPVTKPTVDPNATSEQIDQQVREQTKLNLPVYHVYQQKLRAMDPTVVIVQNQCRVCAVTSSDLKEALGVEREKTTNVVTIQPSDFEGVLGDIVSISHALSVPARGERLVTHIRARMSAITETVRALGSRPTPTVAHLEWLAPLMGSGYWIPMLCEAAGAKMVCGTAGGSTPTIDLQQLAAEDPDIILLAPCGFDLKRTAKEMALIGLLDDPEWLKLRAVQTSRVYVADGNLYYNRSSPRVLEAAEIMAELVWEDELCGLYGHHGAAWVRLSELPDYCSLPASYFLPGEKYASITPERSVPERSAAVSVGDCNICPAPGSVATEDAKTLPFAECLPGEIPTGPQQSMSPLQVVQAQLDAMGATTKLERWKGAEDPKAHGNLGIYRAFEFNSPSNQARLRSADAFASIVRGSSFNVFLHDSTSVHAMVSSQTTNGATVRVTVLLPPLGKAAKDDAQCEGGNCQPVDDPGPPFFFDLVLLDGQWLTDGVRIGSCA